MTDPTRRDLLRGASRAGAAAWLLPTIDRALAIAPAGNTGTLADVEHVVIHMQENRAFDHYLGMLNGVRGFGDPRPLMLPGGGSIWAQPSDEHPDGFVLPYHGDSRTTRSFLVDGSEQSHPHNIHIAHGGRFDRWGHTRELADRMLHYGPGDLPFYYALADAFTVCDAYHCSTLTQTYPNRMHLFSGCNGGGTVGGDPQMTNYGEDETPSADMARDRPLRSDAFRWTPYAERLERAGIAWKVYQEHDNFGDNLLSCFPAFRPAPRGSSLYRRGRAWVSEHRPGADRTRSDGEQLVAAFRGDIASGRLPQVSWIVTAAALSEHPKHEPALGEHVTAELIRALVDHPEVFARTIFILTYDEPGGFFDHMPPPLPPVGDWQGHSTVDLSGEAKRYDEPDALSPGIHPIGLGMRVPTVLVSPWSRGGFVCSQLFDHTSILRLLEARFGVAEPNISAWRRSVCGDLTSAFDFARGAVSGDALPATGDFRKRVARSAAGRANAIPEVQRPTRQMSGRRRHRPLPYDFAVEGSATSTGFALDFVNRGTVGVTFTVHGAGEPGHYTIGAGDRHRAEWTGAFDLTLRGPNGYWRSYRGDAGREPAARIVERGFPGSIEILVANPTDRPVTAVIASDPSYHASEPHRLVVPAGGEAAHAIPIVASGHWYDVMVTLDGGARWHRRFAGKVETGRATLTDPGIGAMRDPRETHAAPDKAVVVAAYSG